MGWFGKGVLGAVGLAAAGVVIAWATSPDPRYNPASFEDEPLAARIAPMEEAVTLARFKEGETIATLLVLGFDGDSVSGIDLRELGAEASADPFVALASAEFDPRDLPGRERTISIADLLPTGTDGTRHIGIGTNFPEHAEEANSGSVFIFPKFGPATPARTQVRAEDGVLLDYEVEFCMRFDRDIASRADFDAAVKGLFLCADFTNRNALVEMADPDNLDSGYGFSDAKSGPDFFPTGPFLVIPRDWEAFTADLRMTTRVNGEPRQDARGREMTLDFGELAEKALGDMGEARFFYDGGFVKLAKGERIDTSTTLMSGTSEGTIFTGPTRGDMIEAVAAYVLQGGPLSGRDFMDSARETFIANELETRHYLQPGDSVRYASNWLGDIEVEVTR
ncbi:fumarylacetoacetate hydrolase family protein [Qipengyuania vesicularis]|uniref:fumarylacetoacetate hydrolase family protein n=1 Tax=Qipengyuania vesicularis TaxID=2867232 RepID=UPI001C86A34B|nr:fumarylacetoacetate hydrolase family protein [Qipengyuania vesicularis]MBX7526215.1 fumarylacetoacetate hydrolase family protein [Qipengyuania vesicularis]